jgi:hypothetical protein
MKSKINLALMLIVSILASPLGLTAAAQPAPQRFRADLGVFTPGSGQMLVITLSPNTIPNGAVGTGAVSVRIRWMQYGAEGCTGMPAVCRHMVVSQGATPVTMLDPTEALSLNFPGTGAGVRLIVESDSQDVRVNAVILDAAGNITASCCSGTLGSL